MVVNGILEAIQSISDEARRALADPELPRDSFLPALSVSDQSKCSLICGIEYNQVLMDENHRHLVSLGVSHPTLETIRERTKTPYNLTTKLTGAGGGGCTVSLVPDGKNGTSQPT